ncbi:MAG: ankyrin repeat domain-containing protein [Tabrizicola sp.]|nr:ankyrin repeat domain-containing protein [Tabrizicola sp.]
MQAALDAGASVDDFDGYATPLYYAVNRQHLAAAKLLVERGADVNAGTKIYGTCQKRHLPGWTAACDSRPDYLAGRNRPESKLISQYWRKNFPTVASRNRVISC